MGRIVAVVNQKGGVGKTTTAVNLAAALAIAERPTLLVDADPQANSTRALGFDENPDRLSLYDALGGETPLENLVLTCPGLPYLGLVPSDRNLVGAEVELVGVENREFRLRQIFKPIRALYDHILLDCPPSLGLITLNALAAADSVLIPVQCEYFALEGITQLMDTVNRVRESLNPELEIDGVLMTMYDDRTNLSKQVVDEVRSVFGDQVFKTVIPRNIRLGEAPSHGKAIFLYDIRSRGAVAYLDLAKEFVENEEKSAGQGAEESDSRTTDSQKTVGRDAGHAGPVAPERSAEDRHRPDSAES